MKMKSGNEDFDKCWNFLAEYFEEKEDEGKSLGLDITKNIKPIKETDLSHILTCLVEVVNLGKQDGRLGLYPNESEELRAGYLVFEFWRSKREKGRVKR